GRSDQALSQSHTEQVARARPKRQADTEFARTPRREVGYYAVQPDARQQQSQGGEGAYHEHVDPAPDQAAFHELGHRPYVIQRLIGVDLANGAPNRTRHTAWIA